MDRLTSLVERTISSDLHPIAAREILARGAVHAARAVDAELCRSVLDHIEERTDADALTAMRAVNHDDAQAVETTLLEAIAHATRRRPTLAKRLSKNLRPDDTSACQRLLDAVAGEAETLASIADDVARVGGSAVERTVSDAVSCLRSAAGPNATADAVRVIAILSPGRLRDEEFAPVRKRLATTILPADDFASIADPAVTAVGTSEFAERIYLDAVERQRADLAAGVVSAAHRSKLTFEHAAFAVLLEIADRATNPDLRRRGIRRVLQSAADAGTRTDAVHVIRRGFEILQRPGQGPFFRSEVGSACAKAAAQLGDPALLEDLVPKLVDHLEMTMRSSPGDVSFMRATLCDACEAALHVEPTTATRVFESIVAVVTAPTPDRYWTPYYRVASTARLSGYATRLGWVDDARNLLDRALSETASARGMDTIDIAFFVARAVAIAPTSEVAKAILELIRGVGSIPRKEVATLSDPIRRVVDELVAPETP